MKKLFSSLMFVALAAMTFTACEDVPEPYDKPVINNPEPQDGTLPYTSSNLADWSLFAVTADQPWSQGKSYTQATGYQKWDGADTKSNRAVEGWLISPPINTTGASEVKISFDQTIKYTNNVTGWEAYHKIYASNNFDGTNVNAATWEEVTFTPEASPYSDWTLYTSGELQLPSSMANQEKIYVAFWFKAPANASTTWELENFKIESGKAEKKDDPTPPGREGDGTEASPFNVIAAIAAGNKTGAYVKGYIVGNVPDKSMSSAIFTADGASDTNILIATTADETNTANCMAVQLPTGDIRTKLNLKNNAANLKKEVVLYGNIENYFSQVGIKSVTYAVLDGTEIGKKPGDDPTPSGFYSMDFKEKGGQGDWTIDEKSKDAGFTNSVWTFDSKYGMKATAFASSTCYNSESWLVSPKIDFTGHTTATMTVHHALNKFSTIDESKNQAVILASEDGINWSELTVTGWPASLSWNYVDSSVDMSAYAGKANVQIAFKYISSTTSAGTWEIEKLSIE